MKRLVLVVLVLAAFAPATAHAAVPCRDRIYNDWYGDGKIATTYPISCYKDALAHIRADAATYSSLADDIRSAMQGALARAHGHTSVPAQIGKGGKGGVEPAVATIHSKQTTNEQATEGDPSSTIASAPAGETGGGVPLPILVLGALALLLAAAGAAGTVVRRRRSTPS